MLVVGYSADGAQTRIIARGNFSLNASGLLILLLVLAAVTLGLAGLLATQGYWPILVIAVFQLVLVAWLLVRVWKNTWVFEEICIDRNSVKIVHQRFHEQIQQSLDSAWATIRLVQPDSAWQAPVLIVRSGNRQVELGAFLTVDEKLSLAKHLSDALFVFTAWRKY